MSSVLASICCSIALRKASRNQSTALELPTAGHEVLNSIHPMSTLQTFQAAAWAQGKHFVAKPSMASMASPV